MFGRFGVWEMWCKKRKKGGRKAEGGESTSHRQSQAPFVESVFNNKVLSKYLLSIVLRAQSWPLRSAQYRLRHVSKFVILGGMDGC